MRFYQSQHPFYCGVDLHAKTMHVCIVDQAGQVLVHRNLQARPDHFLERPGAVSSAGHRRRGGVYVRLVLAGRSVHRTSDSLRLVQVANQGQVDLDAPPHARVFGSGQGQSRSAGSFFSAARSTSSSLGNAFINWATDGMMTILVFCGPQDGLSRVGRSAS